MRKSPPFPPVPPSGGPTRLCASLAKLAQPAPPLPASTRSRTESLNFLTYKDQQVNSNAPQEHADCFFNNKRSTRNQCTRLLRTLVADVKAKHGLYRDSTFPVLSVTDVNNHSIFFRESRGLRLQESHKRLRAGKCYFLGTMVEKTSCCRAVLRTQLLCNRLREEVDAVRKAQPNKRKAK